MEGSAHLPDSTILAASGLSHALYYLHTEPLGCGQVASKPGPLSTGKRHLSLVYLLTLPPCEYRRKAPDHCFLRGSHERLHTRVTPPCLFLGCPRTGRTLRCSDHGSKLY